MWNRFHSRTISDYHYLDSISKAPSPMAQKSTTTYHAQVHQTYHRTGLPATLDDQMVNRITATRPWHRTKTLIMRASHSSSRWSIANKCRTPIRRQSMAIPFAPIYRVQIVIVNPWRKKRKRLSRTMPIAATTIQVQPIYHHHIISKYQSPFISQWKPPCSFFTHISRENLPEQKTSLKRRNLTFCQSNSG